MQHQGIEIAAAKIGQRARDGLIDLRRQRCDEFPNQPARSVEKPKQEGSRDLQVRATVASSKGLLPGAFAEVSLALGNNASALLIPNQAIIPQARDKKVILCKDGKAKFVVVKTGVRQAGMIEITEGIQAGDTICTTGILFLRPDANIKFSKVE